MIEVRTRYAGYLERQERLVARLAGMEETRIPAELWEREPRGFSREAKEKLWEVRPLTVGQAGRIPGVSPADIAVLLIQLKAGASKTADGAA